MNNNKIGSSLLLGCLLTLLVSATTIFSQSERRPEGIPAHGIEIAPGVFDLGAAIDVDGRQVQGYAFVHPKRRGHHRDGHGGGPGGGNGGGDDSGCFAFLARGANWKTAEPYVLDPSNEDGMSPEEVADWTAMSLIIWELAAGVDIFGSRDTFGVVDGADLSSPDGKNEVFFASIADPGVIAFTVVWGIFSGPPFQRELVEWDAVFDDPDFTWGFAGSTSETELGDTTIMDYLNISAHEFGHAAGLDHPSDSCTEQTMFAFAEEGETQKRTLEGGDIAGIQELY